MMGVVHRHVGGPLLQPDGPDPFRFAKPGSLLGVLQESGFHNVEEETKTLPWTWPGPPEEIWEQVRSIAVPFRPMLDRVPEEMWPLIHAAVHEEVGKYFDGQSVAFGASVILAAGQK